MPTDEILIPLRNRKGEVVAHAIIDAADAHLAEHRWYRKPDGYVVRNMPKEGGGQWTLGLHRAVMGLGYGERARKVDHKNHNKLDNRRDNLRPCTHRENHQNRKPAAGKSSQYRGVSWRKDRQQWAAYGWDGVNHHHLGFFDDELEAARAAAKWRRENLPFTVEDDELVGSTD